MKRAPALALAGLVAGLAGAPGLQSSPALRLPAIAAAATLCGAALALSGRSPRLASAALAVALCALGAVAGSARLVEIDAGAFRASPGAAATVRGFAAAPPRSARDGVALEVAGPAGRLELRAPALPPGLTVGDELLARGSLAEPADWEASRLRRRGIASILRADRAELTGVRRGGVSGALDAVRRRAEASLRRGMPERESALARGFVLGQDDLIDEITREDFRRSGLAHLLAVSGQNVLLLCLLAWPLLAAMGLTLRARLAALLLLIAIYVPVSGAGASIQRAGVMGAAGLVAALAGRPAARWYAVLLAAGATLALNPRVSGDIGWQLSFAAVIGIMLFARRLASLLAGSAARGSPRRAIAEGIAVTAAATAATTPLTAFHFEAVPLAALPANVLALPAVAPAMWLGMLAGIAGQVPALPVEPLNWLNSLCLGYIAQVASWLAAPEWSVIRLGLGTPLALLAAYGLLGVLAELLLRWGGARQGLSTRGRPLLGRLADRPRGGRDPAGRGGRRAIGLATAAAGAALLLSAAVLVTGGRPPWAGGTPAEPPRMRVAVLDVGQGDAILLDPPAGDPILVDAGPPGSSLSGELGRLGVDALAAVVITHDQSDHSGGVLELIRSLPIARFVHAGAGGDLARAVRGLGIESLRLVEGSELRSGELTVRCLWPPEALAAPPAGPADDPNRLSIVLLAEWRHLTVLLTGDAEAEAVPLDPGPVDVLKVAHHGSEDSGLAALLERTVPKLAVISVGANPYGHPARQTLTDLEERSIPIARTDRGGNVVIEADGAGWELVPG